MKPITLLLAVFVFAGSLDALTPNEWRFSQTIDVPAKGFVRVNLPAETLDVARPDLEDVRVLDATDQEVPYLLDRPMPKTETALHPQELRTELQSTATRITLTTGTKSTLKGVIFETPAEFIKAVEVEGSHDGAKWQQLATGQPIFRMAGGAANLRVSFPEGAWEFLRLTIDDSRAAAVPFTGVQLDVAEANAPVESLTVSTKSRDESAGVTRLAVDLGATNLTLASLRIETADPLFTRPVRIAVPQLENDTIHEQTICTGSIYRMDLDGKVQSRLEIPINAQIRGRELIVLIDNGDSPPLSAMAVRCDRRLARLIFLASQAGRYRLLSGNGQCSAPRYDLYQLSEQLKTAAASEVRPASPVANPDYKAPDNLAGLPLTGAKIDIAGWKFQKPIQLSKPGAQQVELDPDVLAHAAADQHDLRIVVEDRQVPFLFERPSISRTLPLTAAPINDSKKPALSRWSLKLPQAGIPIARITCASGSPLFQRETRLWEEVADERGDKFPRELGRASWRRVPDQAMQEFVIRLDAMPQSDTLFLETDDGDNPPIALRDFRASYPVTRVVFEAASAQPISIYYGNPGAGSPRYDVSLIADQLFRAERASATLGSEQKTGSTTERLTQTLTGSARYIFWGVLALVIVALLLLIARLLPKA